MEYLDFLQFFKTPKLHPCKKEVIEKLNYYILNSSYKLIDGINYEELIFWEKSFEQDTEIIEKINEVKQIIYHNYSLKQGLIYKLI